MINRLASKMFFSRTESHAELQNPATEHKYLCAYVCDHIYLKCLGEREGRGKEVPKDDSVFQGRELCYSMGEKISLQELKFR